MNRNRLSPASFGFSTPSPTLPREREKGAVRRKYKALSRWRVYRPGEGWEGVDKEICRRKPAPIPINFEMR